MAPGISEVDVTTQKALGRAIEPMNFRADLMMIRHYAHTYIPFSDWLAEYPATGSVELREDGAATPRRVESTMEYSRKGKESP